MTLDTLLTAFTNAIRYALLAIWGAGVVLSSVIVLAGAFLRGLGGALQAGLVNFRATWQAAHQDTYAHLASRQLHAHFLNPHPQPAALLYFYGPAWQVAARCIRRLWIPTHHSAALWFTHAANRIMQAGGQPGPWRDWPQWAWSWAAAAGYYAGGYFHYVVVLLLVLAFGVFQGILLVVGVIASTIPLLLLGIGSTIFTHLNHIEVRCPYLQCHSRIAAPSFVCPQCRRQHDRLHPSTYGIFHHRCLCGQKLPTFNWQGRVALDRVCPACQRPLMPMIGQAKTVHIPVIGGPAAGKTHFLTAALPQLAGSKRRLKIALASNDQRGMAKQNPTRLADGAPPPETPEIDENASALVLQIRRRFSVVTRLLYFYDMPGAIYSSQDRTMHQMYLQDAQALLIIIDPFSLELVRELYKDQLAQSPIVICQESPDDIVGRVIAALAACGNLHRTLPVAVVLTKADLFDLSSKLGAPAIRHYLEENPAVHSETEALHRLVQRFLREYGAASLMLQLQNHFRRIRYFACSGPADSPGTVEPLDWLIRQTY